MKYISVFIVSFLVSILWGMKSLSNNSLQKYSARESTSFLVDEIYDANSSIKLGGLKMKFQPLSDPLAKGYTTSMIFLSLSEEVKLEESSDKIKSIVRYGVKFKEGDVAK